MTQQFRTYQGSGVDYNALDTFKRMAIEGGRSTAKNMEALGFREIEWSRGESVYLFEHIDTGLIFAFLIEGLGTKNLIAENPGLRQHFGDRTFYDAIAVCNSAMCYNDLITSGAMPVVYGLHPALGSSSHLDGKNGANLVAGTVDAANQAGCTYGPGETPGLRDIIPPESMCLSGAGFGIVRQRKHLIDPRNVWPGLSIVLFGSSGVHANGITTTRDIAAALPDKYLTDIGNGKMYGEELLTPTRIYVELVRRCQDAGVEINYAVNITGHGWRKLMRSPKSVTYMIKEVPPIPPIFRFIMERGPIILREMYGNYNMGVGFAMLIEPHYFSLVSEISYGLDIPLWKGGEVCAGPKCVNIEPLGIVFNEDELQIR